MVWIDESCNGIWIAILLFVGIGLLVGRMARSKKLIIIYATFACVIKGASAADDILDCSFNFATLNSFSGGVMATVPVLLIARLARSLTLLLLCVTASLITGASAADDGVEAVLNFVFSNTFSGGVMATIAGGVLLQCLVYLKNRFYPKKYYGQIVIINNATFPLYLEVVGGLRSGQFRDPFRIRMGAIRLDPTKTFDGDLIEKLHTCS